MKQEDIVISGIGAVCHLGRNTKEIFNSLKLKKISPSAHPTVFKTAIKAPVFEANIDSGENPRELTLALLAADEAMQNAGLTNIKNIRVGVCVGTTIGCMFKGLPFLSSLKKSEKPDLKAVFSYLKNDPANFLKREFSLTSNAVTITTACASGSNAIGIGMEWIRSGVCDVVLSGGTDSLDFIPFTGFNSLRLLSKNLCKPFDNERDGLNLGEGAGFIVLESKEHASLRGMKSDVFLSGYATRADAYHLTAPHPEGSSLKSSILSALEMGGLKPLDIGYVNAHGTATRDNDLVEGGVIKDIFGDDAVFSSTKGYTGHTLGAAGAIEAVICVLGLQESWFPASIGFKSIDESIGIAPLKDHLERQTDHVLSTSLGFGGVNSALVFSKKRNDI